MRLLQALGESVVYVDPVGSRVTKADSDFIVDFGIWVEPTAFESRA